MMPARRSATLTISEMDDGPVNGRIDRPEYDVLNVSERMSLPRQEGSASRIRVGPHARHAEHGALNLVVTVRG